MAKYRSCAALSFGQSSIRIRYHALGLRRTMLFVLSKSAEEFGSVVLIPNEMEFASLVLWLPLELGTWKFVFVRGKRRVIYRRENGELMAITSLLVCSGYCRD